MDYRVMSVAHRDVVVRFMYGVRFLSTVALLRRLPLKHPPTHLVHRGMKFYPRGSLGYAFSVGSFLRVLRCFCVRHTVVVC